MILTIPIFVTKLPVIWFKRAMESVSTIDVKKWADQIFVLLPSPKEEKPLC